MFECALHPKEIPGGGHNLFRMKSYIYVPCSGFARRFEDIIFLWTSVLESEKACICGLFCVLADTKRDGTWS